MMAEVAVDEAVGDPVQERAREKRGDVMLEAGCRRSDDDLVGGTCHGGLDCVGDECWARNGSCNRVGTAVLARWRASGNRGVVGQ
ncbi:MAG: hypothetical protein ACI8PT_002225 [Gammaproteobacteria bacterium]|jgi:hypothetical protein